MNTYSLRKISPVAILTAIFAVFVFSFYIYNNVYAAHVTTTAMDISSGNFGGGGLRLKESSAFAPVAQIQFGSDSNAETLTSITVTFSGTAGTPTWTNTAATSSELLDLATTNGGISLWKETAGGVGFQSASDTQVTLATGPVYGASNTFVITPASAPALVTDNIYYIVLTSDTTGVTNNNAFTMSIATNGIVTSVSSPTLGGALTTQTITVDTIAPTLNTTISGPTNNATNVPISAFMGMFFSENMDFSTMNPANIAFTTGGTPVGAAIKTMPNGFNIIVSNPPTYATSTIFSKVANVVFGTFNIPNSGAFFPQGGTYVSPVAGDIVYFQSSTFPAELGIITNATLTAGTFAVNNFNLSGNQAISKFATATATGAVSASTALTLGDIFVANTTANPTTDRYSWHLVTTAANVDGTGLRLDGASAAPAYSASSNWSKLTPTDTSAVNGTSQVVGTANSGIDFVVGDLVFAKVTANADNLGVYAWHTVTAAQNITTDVAPSTLVLDGAAGAPTFAINSQVSKLSPGATGAVTESATAFSYGDLVFAKTTANANANNSYAFHFVSNGATGANSVALRFDNVTANLSPSTTYVITMGVGLKDKAGNTLASPATVSFTTGANSGANTTPPFVTSSNPQAGNQSFPLNAALRVSFSVAMATSGGGSVLSSANVGLFTSNFGAPGTQVTSVNTYDSATNTVIITPSAPLSANADYILGAVVSTTSSTGTALPKPFFLNFRTSSTTDTTAPTVLGIFPALSAIASPNGTTPLNTTAVTIGFSEDINPSTITGSTITINGGAVGTVSYSPSSRSANFSFTSPLVADTLYTVTVVSGASGVKDLVGNALATNYTSTFRTNSVADVTAPSVSFGTADNFGVGVTFSEAMKTGAGPNAVDNIANYTLESLIGSSISLAGKTVTYDGPTMTAKISGLALQFGNTFKVTVSNLVKDISGNLISTSGTPAANVASGTVANATLTGGNLGVGTFQPPTGTANYTPVNVNPMSRLAGATTGYMVQFPVATSIPSGGSIVLTFPLGFDVTNAAASTAGTESFNNSDINGPLAGTVTIASVANNISARTITVVTGGAATGANAFIRFDLKNIINTTVPSSTGYTVDIKTKDTSSVVLETQTSAAFILGAAGANTLTVNVTKASVGLADVVVFLFSPAIGGTQATTNSSGVATFSNLSSGDYGIGINPASLASSSVVFNTAPQQITISGNTTKNYALDTAPYTIAGTITGTSGDKVDVFASSQNGFIKKTMTLTGGADAYSLPVQGSTTYNVGVGPAIPDSFQQAGSALPPPPTFTFIPPPSLQVVVAAANVTGKNFSLTVTNRTITGTVTDSAGNGLNGVQLFARPAGNSTTGGSTVGMGTSAQTSSTGAFTLNVSDGTYIVEAFKSGFPASSSKQISVASGGNTPSTLAFKFDAASTLTITGSIKDDGGNAVAYAGVSARKVISTTNTGVIGGDSSNFVGGPADANGSYTLYVDAGTWIIEAFAPGFGRLGSKTVTVGTTSLTGQDFSAASLNMGTITGTASKASVLQQGVVVRAEGSSGANMGVTDSTGTYSLKVPAGSYTLTCMFPGVGESTPLTAVAVTASTTTSGKNCSVATPITIIVNLTDGTNPISNAFVDVRDSNGRGNGTNVSTTSGINAVYTITVAPGTYTVRAGSQIFGQVGTTTSVSTSQTITYTAAAGRTYNITGTVTGDGSNLAGAWVSVRGTPTGTTIPINVGAQTASNGSFTIAVPNGSYQIRADKPSYTSPVEATATVASVNISAGTIALTTAARTISGTVTLSGSGVSNAFVDASNGAGGFAVTQTDTTGAFSLSVNNGTWTIRARSLGYDGAPTTVIVSGSNITGQTIALSAISGFTITAEKQETVTPTAPGIFTNSDIGANFKVTMPANTLGNTSNSATFATKANTNVPTPQSGTILSKNAVSISALDSGGLPITTLGDSVTVVVPYDESLLPTGAVEANLVLATWNTATNQYDTVPTVVNTTTNTLTMTIAHFSDYAPLLPSGGAPSTPSGLTGIVSGNTQVNLTWTAVSEATGYDIYRSTTSGGAFGRIGSEPTVSSGSTTSYSDTGLSSGAIYYYKISALTGSNESAASGAISVATSGGGGGGASVYVAPTATVTPVIPAVPATKIEGCITGQMFSTTSGKSCVVSATPATPASASGKVYNFGLKTLKNGSRGDAVMELQRFLNAKLNLGLVVDGKLGPKTIKVIKKWQKDNGLVVDGLIGPKTKTKMNASVQ